MDLPSPSRQQAFQAEVAEHYEHIAASKNVTDDLKQGLLEFLQLGAATSDEVISLRGRLVLAHISVDTMPYPPRTRLEIRNAGSRILKHSFSDVQPS